MDFLQLIWLVSSMTTRLVYLRSTKCQVKVTNYMKITFEPEVVETSGWLQNVPDRNTYQKYHHCPAPPPCVTWCQKTSHFRIFSEINFKVIYLKIGLCLYYMYVPCKLHRYNTKCYIYSPKVNISLRNLHHMLWGYADIMEIKWPWNVKVMVKVMKNHENHCWAMTLESEVVNTSISCNMFFEEIPVPIATYEVPFLCHMTSKINFFCNFVFKHQCNRYHSQDQMSNVKGQRQRSMSNVNVTYFLLL